MTKDLADLVSKALCRAYSLGQIYWQRADSESYAENKRSVLIEQQFDALVTEINTKILGEIA